jgi:DNA adenine methylase
VTLRTPIAKVRAPPLKCQGIKTKMVNFIHMTIPWSGDGTWVEPFAGSGVVAFNLRPERARLYDLNPHVIRLYQGIQAATIAPETVRAHLEFEGERLRRTEGTHYYDVRARFNETADPLDYLFLNRSCFNGLVRFNKKGKFNVPFCKKPDRFRPAYVTKIVNQVAWVTEVMAGRDWRWVHADWRVALSEAEATDFVYMDPPYIGRHADYFSGWSEVEAQALAERAQALPCGLALSMWLQNKYRYNTHIDDHWGWTTLHTTEHFYHLGAQERLRNTVIEALATRAAKA